MAASDPVCEPGGLSTALEICSTQLRLLLEEHKSQAQSNLPKFLEEGITQCGKAMRIYKDLFLSGSGKTRESVDATIKKNFKNSAVRDNYENLISVEDDWNLFLHDIDPASKDKAQQKILLTGDRLQPDIRLLDPVSKESVTLKQVCGAGGEHTGEHTLLVLLRHYA